MTKKIAYLASKVTLPGSATRRDDAFEHDRMMDALRAPFAALDMHIQDVDWADMHQDWGRYDAALIGTTWDYWDHADRFLATLEQIEQTTPLFNPSPSVAWNSKKTYLRDLEVKGARLIPTIWLEVVTPEAVARAFDTLDSDDLVFKRQIGAGAAGQYRLSPDAAIPDMPHAMMVQPFLDTIQTEGEISFIFIEGAFCHALIKRAAPGDYRIQSSYGGVEETITPCDDDIGDAKAIMAALDSLPLYARVDMLRDADGRLLLMELELIEPYLYPLEGEELGPRLAAGMARRLRA